MTAGRPCVDPYARAVSTHADVANEAFVATATGDLQRQLRASGRVVRLDVEPSNGAVAIHAVLAVARDELRLTATGPTLVEAYAALIRAVPANVLSSAFRQMLEAP